MNNKFLAPAFAGILALNSVPAFSQTNNTQGSIQTILDRITCDASLGDKVEKGNTTENNFFEFLKCAQIERVEIEVQDGVSEIVLYSVEGKEERFTVRENWENEIIAYLLEKNIPISQSNKIDYFQIAFFIVIVSSVVLTYRMQKKAGLFGSKKKHTPIKTNIKFEDIGGITPVKDELMKIVNYILEKDNILKRGGKIPKGVLLSGPGGVGKTLLAKAVAGESSTPFLYMAGSEFEDMFVGGTQKEIRELFKAARKIAKKEGHCIVFIDEIDAIGAKRSQTVRGAADKGANSSVNQILTEMDGFETTEGIIVFAATNNPDILDDALVRPGRFDRKIYVPYPDNLGRIEIFQSLTRKIENLGKVDFESLSARLPNASGATLANIVNEALLFMSLEGDNSLEQKHFEHAIDKELLGIETGVILSPEEAKRIAVHEAGHAVAALLNPNARVHKVSIIPRGRSLGVTITPPFEEKVNPLLEDLMLHIKLLVAGRIAESIVLGSESVGALDDIKRATEIARAMVMEYGWKNHFVGQKDSQEKRDYNGINFRFYDKDASILPDSIDESIDLVLFQCVTNTKKFLEENRALLDALTKKLISEKQIDRQTFEEMHTEYFAGKKGENISE